MKLLKKIGLMWLCCLLFSFPVQEAVAGNIDAEETESLSIAEKLEQAAINVIEIELFYRLEDGGAQLLHTGSGFFIGDGEEAPQYVLTANQVVSLREEEKAILQSSGCKESDVGIQIIIKQDVTVGASVVTSSDEMGFALLNLEQPIYDRSYMILNNTFEQPESEMEIYSMGVVGGQDGDGTAQVSRGFLIPPKNAEGKNVWRHDSYRNSGYIGGPLVDAEGTVLGINQSDADDEFLQAIQVGEILPVLDALGIAYRTTAMEAREQQEEKQQLQNAMDSAAAIQESFTGNTPDTGSVLRLILMIIGVVVFITGMVILIVLLKTKEKRTQKKKKRQEEFTVTQAAPVFEGSLNDFGEAVLIRVKTGQKERISRERFLIGKERGSTDFYIGDNSAVSRMHALILKKQDGYFLTELQATNGTFLNDVRIYPDEEKMLKSGDKIRLADEEFEFLSSGGMA